MIKIQAGRATWVGSAALLLVTASPAARPAQAGKRISPVAPLCSSTAFTKEIDADGPKDRCVDRTAPTCAAGQKLATDAVGTADRCVPEASGPAAPGAGGEKPHCREGLGLKAKAGEDVCEHAEKPVCPSGFKLNVRPKEDACVP